MRRKKAWRSLRTDSATTRTRICAEGGRCTEGWRSWTARQGLLARSLWAHGRADGVLDGKSKQKRGVDKQGWQQIMGPLFPVAMAQQDGRTALPGRGWGADGPGRGRGRVALSATVARRPHDGLRFWRRSLNGSRDAGLGPPAGGPRPSGEPSRMKSCARPVGDRRWAW
eukprot:362298-Chlamydomonas_euryale.AAC.4